MAVRQRSVTSAASMALATLIASSTLALPAPAFSQESGQQEATGGGTALPGPSDELLSELEEIYKDIHANPELSMQEERTAGIAADWLREQGYDVTEGLGGTGVVGLLENGEGATVLLRADMEALPMAENTGLPYESTKTVTGASGQEVPVAHSCGHDMHVAWLMGATQILAENTDQWSGTVIALFQPGEETGEGARAMVEDGLIEQFPQPDVMLAQHVLPLSAGKLGTRGGLFLSQSDSMTVTLHGSGGHGSSPESTIDPIVMAAATVMRLQTIVSRELGMTDSAVLSVGSINAGSSANIIPNEAELQLNLRTFNDQVRDTVLSSIERIVMAEAEASGAEQQPEITMQPGEFPLTINDEEANERVTEALRQRLGEENVQASGPQSASEDASVISREWGIPLVYWATGGIDPQQYAEAEENGTLNQIPSNHSPEFAPVIDPTLRTGVEAMLAAAGAWLVASDGE